MSNFEKAKEIVKTYNYKGFTIIKGISGKYVVLNNGGQFIRNCNTLKECKNRIDTQTV